MKSMRIYRVETDDGLRYVVENGDRVFHLVGDLFDSWEIGAELLRGLEGLKIVAPVVPSKIVAVGLNYRAHAAEQGKPLPPEPLIFIKPSTSVIGPGDAIVIPPGIGRVDHEAEVGVVIGRRATRVPASEASRYILGVTAVNDVTAREIQRREGQYTRPKGFDTFAPVGPAIALGLDPDDLGVEGWVNAERRQASSTRDLIFPVAELVAFISSVMTLLPGDIISTGTPAGIGPVVPGDVVRVTVAGVGDLVNPVESLS
jgi:2-keto-4-pentenoate hydratase/2-oxohepta-3-ene-1,7-dioic acid hydratase in catechol pathway